MSDAERFEDLRWDALQDIRWAAKEMQKRPRHGPAPKIVLSTLLGLQEKLDRLKRLSYPNNLYPSNLPNPDDL